MYSAFSGHVRGSSNDNDVKVTLDCLRSGLPMKHSTRQLSLSLDNPSVTIGRASKSHSKKLQSGPDNGFFDCAVMSRDHAEIYLSDGLQGPVMIRDSKSLHGTFLNNSSERIEKTKAVALNHGDSLKFGDQISRMQDVHLGVEVRVSLSRPPLSRFSINANAISTQPFTLDTQTPKSNTFEVPDESDDNITPSDDDKHQTSIHGLHHTMPLSKSFVSDAGSSRNGLSQFDPVVIDDEDVSAAARAEAGSPLRRLSDDQREESPVYDSEDDQSEAEYAAFEDDGGYGSASSDEGSDHDNESVTSDAPKNAHKVSTTVLNDQESDVDDLEDFALEQNNENTTIVAEAPSNQIFSTAHTLPEPDNSVQTSKIDLSNILAPMYNFSGRSRFDIPPPSVARNALGWTNSIQPALANYNTTYESDKQAISGHRASSPFTYLHGNKSGHGQVHGQDYSRFDSQHSASVIEDLPSKLVTCSEPSGIAKTMSVTYSGYDPVADDDKHAVESLSVSNKRKRDEVNDEDAQDIINDMVEEKVKDDNARVGAFAENIAETASEAAVEERRDSASELPEQSERKKTKKAKKEVESRPVKRARTTSNVGLVLTAAAGAVGGCVATVSFLWSPLAERLLA